ncbi:hypothetical protein SBDP1_420005 [Syntrophobacter sp. SbD1]|nr:hypothetical protein SBDP1_420005 [Syntrophobacter sp. SbD1]
MPTALTKIVQDRWDELAREVSLDKKLVFVELPKECQILLMPLVKN